VSGIRCLRVGDRGVASTSAVMMLRAGARVGGQREALLRFQQRTSRSGEQDTRPQGNDRTVDGAPH